MAVARLVAAPFLLPTGAIASSRVRSPPAAAAQRLVFAPLSVRAAPRSAVRRSVPVRVASDDRVVVGGAGDDGGDAEAEAARAVAELAARKQSERRTYLVAAVMSSLGITSMAAAAVYYRFAWQMEGGEIPVTEMFGTFALSVGAAVGMEFWARWAHRALWHASLWHMHESHHRPRDGPFELNDVFAIVNAVPAMSLLAYGFFNRGLLPGLCFGPGDYAVRDGVHVRPRRPRPPPLPRGPHRERALLPVGRRRPSDTSHGHVRGRALRPVPWAQGAGGGGRDRGAGEGDQAEDQEERDLRCDPMRATCHTYYISLLFCLPLSH
ncbi:beta-carotene 3-hydroxylase, chloroplastic-like isoform X1 [Phragmites australis]|uniref:beta-carotene 3-hydroxylase, chloroplastic-like isoform X1 n=1 Tax=Phragmites australis TaxID=29695 RepID=UPI002D765353|nr:beta-carotene 3-hydroxylase, chloroplastic-like isoform X1 [Phragmites australis]